MIGMIRIAMNELFPFPESSAPLLVQLRRQYEEAKSAYDEAFEMGQMHESIKWNLIKAGRALMAEEQRQMKLI